MIKRWGILALTLAVVVSLSACEKEFKDVPEGAWFAKAVDYVKTNKLMSGTSETTFEPDKPMTRAMLVTVLYRKAGEPELSEASAENQFSDVPADSWCADAVYWAKENGITAGIDETHFMPDMTVNREQTAVMLWREAGKPGSSGFASCNDRLKINPYAIMAVNWAWENGFMKGSADNNFDPFAPTTRAQFAQILYNKR